VTIYWTLRSHLGYASRTVHPQVKDTGVGVLDKSVQLIELLAERGSARLPELVAGTGFSRPTAHRLLAALEAHGLVGRSRSGTYRLGLRHLEWGARAAAGIGLIEAARPVLDRLRDVSAASSQIYLRDGDARICVGAAEPVSGLRDTVPVGMALPLHLGSGGKVLLAWADDRDRFPAVSVDELATVRKRGWAASVGEREPGVASISAPVLDLEGRIRAAISISGPIERLGRDPGSRWAVTITEAARELERRALEPI
jgi:DNA-binding IclR family transcriptional regulator